MNCNHWRPVKSLQQILKCKEILKTVLLFQTVKQAIGSIFCVANNKKYKVHLFEVVHLIQPPGQPYDCVVFILTRADVKYNV
jgi:hypothetical protein